MACGQKLGGERERDLPLSPAAYIVAFDHVPFVRKSQNNRYGESVCRRNQNNQGRGKVYQAKPKAEADNPYQDPDYSGYHKNQV